MARVLLLGAGVGGLCTATLLARAGHDVTVLERDPGPPPSASATVLWEGWQRRGVTQFRMPHIMLARWWHLVRQELPDVEIALHAVGAARINPLAAMPAERRGLLREDDERFTTVTARRPVLEAALTQFAGSAGVTIRRGVAVTGLTTDGGAPVPRVTGVLTDAGQALTADLVVDCGGRRSALPAWLAAAGARRPVEERSDLGFVYYGRHFRSSSGELPEARAPYVQNYDSLTVLTLPADNGTWSVVLTTSGRDKPLRALRDPACWHAALRLYPAAAHWADAAPISGVDVMAGLDDRRRTLVTADGPVATGIVAVGDAWACTNPSLGRGASMAVIHACLLRDLLDEVDPDDHDKFARRFGEVISRVLDPLYDATQWYDRHRLAELEADAAGAPYRTDDQRWHVVKAVGAAALVDEEVLRAHMSMSSFICTADEALAVPGVLGRVLVKGMGAPQYPLPGPRRPELLAVLDS